MLTLLLGLLEWLIVLAIPYLLDWVGLRMMYSIPITI
jgi:hypothetical protein